MSNTLLRAVLSATLACAIFAGPALAKPHRASDDEGGCKPPVTAMADGVTSTRARTRAIEVWRTKVSSEVSADYANPDKAQSTSMHCHKVSVAKHECTLKARPCKSTESGKSGKHSH